MYTFLVIAFLITYELRIYKYFFDWFTTLKTSKFQAVFGFDL
jgi:hypothetical protein